MGLQPTNAMCTVTYIPTAGGFILTSSRDEQVKRSTAAPALYEVNGNKIVFPKDEMAGGTWIASNLNERKACLLNGAFTNHIKKTHHNKSRGNMLLDSFSYQTIDEFARKVDLYHVEPFTLLLFEGNINPAMLCLVWDGEKKHISHLNFLEPQIWSSATLYNSQQKAMRSEWFYTWLNNHEEYNDYRIADFHLQKHTNESDINIFMKRNESLQTVSISQLISTCNATKFVYHDFLKQQQTTLDLKSPMSEIEKSLQAAIH